MKKLKENKNFSLPYHKAQRFSGRFSQKIEYKKPPITTKICRFFSRNLSKDQHSTSNLSCECKRA